VELVPPAVDVGPGAAEGADAVGILKENTAE